MRRGGCDVLGCVWGCMGLVLWLWVVGQAVSCFVCVVAGEG